MTLLRRFLTLGAAALSLSLIAVASFPAAALAADDRQGNTVTVARDEVVNDDLYVAAGTVDIQGTVHGSVIAIGGSINISGTVDQDVMVGGGTVDVSGPVGGAVRVAGGQLTFSGKTGTDLVATGGSIDLSREATVGRDVLAAGGTVSMLGSVTRNVKAGGSTVDLGGPIGGDVVVNATNLHLLPGAALGGTLDYTSQNLLRMDKGASVQGTTVHHTPPSTNNPAAWLYGWTQAVVGLFVLGLVTWLVAPGFFGRTVAAYNAVPWSRLGIGATLLIVVPLAALIVLVAGLLFGGWWLSVFLMGIYTLAAVLGFALASQMAGHFLLDLVGARQSHVLVDLLVGVIVLTLLSALPFVGWLFRLAAVVYGLGSMALAVTWGRGAAPPSMATPAPVPVAAGRPVAG